MSNWLSHHEEGHDVTTDLAKTLPRWVSWVPVLGKASYRWWSNRRARARPENNISVDFLRARIDVNARDEASVDLVFQFTNFGSLHVEIDRMELHTLSVGNRSLQRRGDMLKMIGAIRPRSVSRLSVAVDVHGSDIRNIVQGVSKSVNLWTSPQVNVAIYADILFITKKGRFRKTLQHTADAIDCHVRAEVAEVLVKADGVATI